VDAFSSGWVLNSNFHIQKNLRQMSLVFLRPRTDITTNNPEDMEVSRHAESRRWQEPALQPRGHAIVCTGANDVLKRFTRETEWVAAGVLAAVFIVAVAFATLVPERYPKGDDLPREAIPAKTGFSLNDDAAKLLTSLDLSARKTTSEVTSEEPVPGAPGVVQTSTETSPKANFAGMAAGATSTPLGDVALSPEVNRVTTGVNESKWFPGYRQNSVRVTQARIAHDRIKLSGRRKVIDVKKRLIALWHQSLLQTEKARTWAAYSNLSISRAAYTAGKDP
jgi:hypothetical protein